MVDKDVVPRNTEYREWLPTIVWETKYTIRQLLIDSSAVVLREEDLWERDS